jgi:hypothetical protein
MAHSVVRWTKFWLHVKFVGKWQGARRMQFLSLGLIFDMVWCVVALNMSFLVPIYAQDIGSCMPSWPAFDV